VALQRRGHLAIQPLLHSVSTTQRNDACVVAVDPSLAEILRRQGLAVLERNHEPLDEVDDLAPSELLALAAVLRDAIAVLDEVGWLPEPRVGARDVSITHGHLAQLERLRADLAMAILDRLDVRAELTSAGERAEVDEEIDADRVTAEGLLRLLRAGQGIG
jgi:hypothetical protein